MPRFFCLFRDFYALHLLASHRHYLMPEDYQATGGDFNEENIQGYNGTFGVMAREVLRQVEESQSP